MEEAEIREVPGTYDEKAGKAQPLLLLCTEPGLPGAAGSALLAQSSPPDPGLFPEELGVFTIPVKAAGLTGQWLEQGHSGWCAEAENTGLWLLFYSRYWKIHLNRKVFTRCSE